MLGRIATALALGVGLAWSTAASAQDTVKIGVILPYSGPFADAGKQLDAGIKLYMQQHGDEVAGKKIEIIRKDVGGVAPDVAKRLAQELVVRDHVDVLAGFALSPNALAAGDVSKKAKKFMVVMNGAASSIVNASPYIVRTSVTEAQLQVAFGKWAATHGAKDVYTLVSDYAPGHDAQKSFEEGFTSEGGKVVGSDKMPVRNPDFSAFVQRVKAAKPGSVFVFVPGGSQPAALGKALVSQGLSPKDMMILGQGELTLPEALKSMGDTAEGIVTAFHYTLERKDPKNEAFVAAYEKANDGRAPDLFSIGGYDGMHLIYAALEKTKGKAGGEALTKASEGMSWDSPRGPISIDPATRDIVQTVWIRKVEKVDGKLQNVIIDKIENVKDPTHKAK